MTINKIQRNLLNICLRDIFTKCEYLFLIDIYIISLFVLMSFDNYIYLILKKVPFNCEDLWSGCSVWILLCNVLDRYICYFPSWNIWLCCYFMVSKCLFNVLLVFKGYNKWNWLQTIFFFWWSTVIKVFCCPPVAVIPAFVVYTWILLCFLKFKCKCFEFLFYFSKKITDGVLLCMVHYQ